VAPVRVDYAVENGELVVRKGEAVRYRGRPSGYPAEKVGRIPNSSDAILLLRYWTEKTPDHFPNLLRVGPDGAVRWSASPPEHEPGAQDAWVAFELAESGALLANSWSAFRCTIDVESGGIISRVFTK
jgi:hypothetical protein